MNLPPSLENRFTEKGLQVLKAIESHPAPTLKTILQEIFYAQGSVGANFLRAQGLKRADVNAIRETQPSDPQGYLREIVQQAVKVAAQFKHRLVGTQHLLYGFFKLARGERTLRRFFSEFAAPVPRLQRSLQGLLAANSRFPDLDDLDATDFLLPDILEELRDLHEGDFNDFSRPADEDIETMHEHSLAQLKPKRRQSQKRRARQQLWEQFGVDLTKEAEENRLDPLIGRQDELERVIQILGRRTKSNPVLIGEAGVGKTAIVHGLAQAIAQEKVPPNLLNKKVYDLRLSQLVAGTVFRGEFEARLEAVLKEAKEAKVILFIDEVHQVVGAGSASGSLDAAGILKPALAKGEIQVVGATTLDEYRQYIEQDKALARRFQPVRVKEPSLDSSTKVLKGLKKYYEDYHKLKITGPALRAAVELSKKYITDRRLPDKAIDIIDEAAVRAKSRFGLSEKRSDLKALEAKLRDLETAKALEIDKGAYDKAFAVKKEQKALEQQIASLQEQISQEESQQRIVVARQDIKEVVAKMTGIPVAKLTVSERRRLDRLEEVLGRYIIGQEQAISELATTIRRSRAGLSPTSRPLGSFIFMGPTGVGKTETSKVLAREVFGEDALVKLDMSEFMEPHTISRLLGAPAGYVGYGEGGELTEKVRRNPYSVVLFDEIEKAHPRINNILLQILEDGRLTDAMGREVDFRNTIVILTSNIGTRDFTKKAEIGFASGQQPGARQIKEDYQRIKLRSLKALRATMKPELLNRLDDVIVFRPLSSESIAKIAEKQLIELSARLKQERNITLSWSAKALANLAKMAFNPKQGARPVRRVIQTQIENILAQKIVRKEIKTGMQAKICLQGKKLNIRAG